MAAVCIKGGVPSCLRVRPVFSRRPSAWSLCAPLRCVPQWEQACPPQLQVRAGSSKASKKSGKKAWKKARTAAKAGHSTEGEPSNGAPAQAAAPSEGVHAVPLSQLKKVSQQSLQAVATACIAEMYSASQEQVDKTGDGRDEEVIHDLRVALRRLRSVVDGFDDVLALPKSAQRKSITRVLKTLGRLRDADVMQETLDNVLTRTKELPSEESSRVAEIREAMLAVREAAIEDVASMLKGHRTQDLTKGLQSWLAQPVFKAGMAGLVAQKAGAVAPALALPRVAAVLKHPAWSIDEISSSGQPPSGSDSSTGPDAPPAVSSLDSKQCATMHDLRKKIRELRYMLELLAPVYSKAKEHKKALQHITRMQSLLGDLQDLEVLSQFIGDRLGGLPTLAAAMAEAHQHTWRNWLETRAPTLTTSGRAGLVEAVLWPNGKNSTDLIADSDEEVLTEDEPSDSEKAPSSGGQNGKGKAVDGGARIDMIVHPLS